MHIPEKVSNTFGQLYPDTDLSQVSWGWSVPGKLYEATFVDDEELLEVEITLTGHHLCTKRTVDTEAIPAPVLDTIGSEFQGFDLEGIDEIVFSDGTLLYEAGFLALSGDDEEKEDENEEEAETEEDEEETDEADLDEPEDAAYGEYFEVYIQPDGTVLMEAEEEEEAA